MPKMVLVVVVMSVMKCFSCCFDAIDDEDED